jgi:hypothetical protein
MFFHIFVPKWIRLAQESPQAGFCEHGSEPSGSIKEDIFDNLSDNQLFKQYPAPWSK